MTVLWDLLYLMHKLLKMWVVLNTIEFFFFNSFFVVHTLHNWNCWVRAKVSSHVTLKLNLFSSFLCHHELNLHKLNLSHLSVSERDVRFRDVIIRCLLSLILWVVFCRISILWIYCDRCRSFLWDSLICNIERNIVRH